MSNVEAAVDDLLARIDEALNEPMGTGDRKRVRKILMDSILFPTPVVPLSSEYRKARQAVYRKARETYLAWARELYPPDTTPRRYNR